MGDEADGEYRAERIGAAFALLTATLEDAATIAAEGQGRHRDQQLQDHAQQITELAGEASTIAGALAALLISEKIEPQFIRRSVES